MLSARRSVQPAEPLSLLRPMTATVFANQTRTFARRSSAIAPTPLPEDRRIPGSEDVKGPPAFPAVIEHGRSRPVKWFVPRGIHEIGHLEPVDLEAVFLHRVCHFQRVHAVASPLH